MNIHPSVQHGTLLPIRPKPMEWEATLGYLMRVAHANGYESHRPLQMAFKTLEAFKAALWLSDEDLETLMGPYPPKWQQKPLGDLNVSDFNTTLMRWCPLCLRESSHLLPGIWLLKLSCVCIRHNVQLVDRCQQCGRQQRFIGAHFARCECDTWLSMASIKEASPALVRVAKMMEAAFLETPSTELPWPQLPKGAWLKLASYLGQYSETFQPTKPGKVADLHKLEMAMALMMNTAQLLDEWPTNFHGLLAAILQKETQPTSLHRAFGSLFRVLYFQMKEPHFQFLRDGFEAFVHKHWGGVIGKRNLLFSPYTIHRHPQLTLKQAAQKAGTEVATVRHLLEAELITAHQAKLPSGRRTISIHRAHVSKIARLTQHSLSLKEGAKWLALPKSRVRQLLDAGLIKPLISPKDTHAASWQIPHKELQWLKFKPQPMSNGSAEISINKILQHWRLQDDEFIALVSGLMNKELLPIAAQSKPIVIGKIQLNRDKFQAWLDKRRLTATPTMSVDQAAKILGLKQQVVYELVRKGLMESTHDQAKGYRISTNQIRQFQEKFVSLAELARLRKCLPRKLLLEMNVPPVCGPTADGTRQYFFLRAEIDSA